MLLLYCCIGEKKVYYGVVYFRNKVKRFLCDQDVLKRLIIINCVVFVLVFIINLFGVSSNQWIGLPSDFSDFLMRPWTIITYMFVQNYVLHILFSDCLKILHFSQGKSGILKVQSGSNEEQLMPRQSLRITRRLTCDTLPNPERGLMTYRRLDYEPSDFL